VRVLGNNYPDPRNEDRLCISLETVLRLLYLLCKTG